MSINPKITFIFLLMFFIISGCSAITTISSKQPNVSIMVKDKSYSSLPMEDGFAVTTFGNYEFLAEKEGNEPLYGVLPRNFSVGHLVIDILFFTPLCLFNLFEVFPYYEIDMDKKLIRYSIDNTEWWDSYIQPHETEQAKEYFKKAGKKEGQNKFKTDKIVVDNKSNDEIIKTDISASSNSGTQQNSPDTSELAYKLRELKKLKDEGLITDKEYEIKKKAIVDGI